MDAAILLKAIVSATILLWVLVSMKNIYYVCVVTSAGWDALKRVKESIGFIPEKLTILKTIKWLFLWPLLLPAKIHGYGKAEAQICDDVIAIAFPSGVCGDPEFCAKAAGEGLAEVLTERSLEYSFDMSDLKIDEEEALVLCVIKRRRKEKNNEFTDNSK